MKEAEERTSHRTRPEDRVSFAQLAAYGSGGIIPIALFNIAGILVGLMGNISLGLSAFWLGVILIIPRLWDAVSDPIIGHLSDNTRSRFGRRRPFLLLGGVLVAVFFVVMWWIPKGDIVQTWFSTESGSQAFQLVYILFALLLFYTSTTLFEIPHGALGMELTTDYHERTRLFSAKSFVGNLFAMSTPWLFALANMEIFRGTGGNEADGMRYVSLMIAAFIIPLSFWWFFKLKEPGFVKAARHEKTPFWHDMRKAATNRNFIFLTLTIFILAMGFNFVQLLGSYIPIFYVFGGDKVAGANLLGINGTVWAVTGVLAVFPLNWISPKVGKRNTLFIAIVLMCLAQLSKIVCYNPNHPYLVVIPTMMLSTGMLFFFTLGSSMVGDICDEDELKTGYRAEGSFYSIFWWFIKMGTAFASFVGGALIVLTMFDEIQVTKFDALRGNVRELHSEVQFWSDSLSLKGTGQELVDKVRIQGEDALKESQDYLKYLEKETGKMQVSENQTLTEYQEQRQEMLLNALSITRSTVSGLGQIEGRFVSMRPPFQDSLVQSLAKEAIPLTLQTKLLKARVNSFELLSHLETRSLERERSKEHYEGIIQTMIQVDDRVTGLSTTSPVQELDQELVTIRSEVIPLMRQSPYTLLMMRVVEIGLPLLLSIFSVIFVFRYALTEKRSHEIKELLRKRNEEQSSNQNTL